VLARDNQTLQSGFYRIDLAGGSFTKLVEAPQALFPGVGFMEVSDTQGTVAYLAESVNRPADVWITGPDMRNPHPITNINPQLIDYQLGVSRLIDWKSLDGVDLHGAVLLPTGYRPGTRCPLIVYVYGGFPLSTALNEWGGGAVLNMQLLATRGYAVLFPDSPLQVGTPMQDLAKTVLPGVQKAVELGIADPNRVGIMGHSYGAYSTLALVVQSKTFRAAVAVSGPVNLINAYVKSGAAGGGIGWVEHGQGAIGGSLWEYRDRFIENSPLFYFDRIQIPVLIIHGESDQIVPVAESRIAFESLRKLGKRVVFAEYQREGHRPQQWNYLNQVDFCDRVLNWFEEHLRVSAERMDDNSSSVGLPP